MKEKKNTKTPNVSGSQRYERARNGNVESKTCKLWNKKQICKQESFELDKPPGLQPGQSLKSGGTIGSQSLLWPGSRSDSVLLPPSMRNKELTLLILLRFTKIILKARDSSYGAGFDIRVSSVLFFLFSEKFLFFPIFHRNSCFFLFFSSFFYFHIIFFLKT